MRVWGSAPPHTLNRFHLLGEHNEIHVLLQGKWPNHPESLARRFDNQLQFLVFRHELIRAAMNDRWPGRHTAANHKTPPPAALDPLDNPDLCRFLAAYERDPASYDPPTFIYHMAQLNFPQTSLEHDTPWDRDGFTPDEYVRLGDDWTNEYRNGKRSTT